MLKPYTGKWDGFCALIPQQQVALNEMNATEEYKNAITHRKQI